jgi:DNA-binding beta-propeller fold protein YncE
MPRRLISVLLTLAAAYAVDWTAPAGDQTVARRPGSDTVIPGGRIVHPFGEQHATGPGPFGLAVSPDGNTAVSADGGPGRFSLTFLDRTAANRWQVRALGSEKVAENDDWRGVFMGLAFDTDKQLYASEGNSGSVRLINPSNGRLIAKYELNQGGFNDSYSGDLVLDRRRDLLYVVDQANFRVVIFDIKKRRLVKSVRVGRLPFSIALSPDGRRAYVTNLGMFEYQPLPGAGVSRPAHHFPSGEAERGSGKAPGLGSPHAPEANSLCVLDVEDPADAKVLKFIKTGLEFGPESLGGSSPSGVVATADRIFVANSHNDSITVLDAFSLLVLQNIPLRVPGLESLRGVLPIGMTFHASTGWLLVAEAGLNAIAVIDPRHGQVLGHIPAGWFPTRVAVDADRVFVANAKGFGTGANADKTGPLARTDLRRGVMQIFTLPKSAELPELTARVWEYNGAIASRAAPAPIPPDARYVVLIVKAGRTFDEVMGDIESQGGAMVRAAPELARFGKRGRVEVDRDSLRQRFSLPHVNVTPNHRELATRWAFSDNFYAESYGHHWLAGVYPNAWTESATGLKEFRWPTAAPGRLLFAGRKASVHPEEQLEDGTIWHHLERNGIPFRNYGEGLELAGSTAGARYLTNVPMPAALAQNTVWTYPAYDPHIPDQVRATRFIDDVKKNYVDAAQDLPRFLYIHLPGDQLSTPRPGEGYPFAASYMADNDLALGRIVEFLSGTPWWNNMVVFVTEDDAQGGVDHVDSHRTLLMALGPHVKRGYLSRRNSSYPGLLKTIFRTLRVGPLTLFDAWATDLADVYAAKPDYAPYKAVPVNTELFDPAKLK